MIVDYLTVTLNGQPRDEVEVVNFLDEWGLMPLFNFEQFVSLPAWKPFKNAYGNSVCRVQWRDSDAWSSFSITGKGCQVVRGALSRFIGENRERVTRIDIAQDATFETSFSPVKHAQKVKSRTRSIIESDTGETLYIGSRKSASFVRVYRYNEPHERAGITRIEAEFKSDYARSVASVVADDGVNAPSLVAWIVRKTATEGYRIWHGLHDSETKPMRANRKPGQDGYTKWLRQAALPAVRRALREGLITMGDVLGGV